MLAAAWVWAEERGEAGTRGLEVRLMTSAEQGGEQSSVVSYWQTFSKVMLFWESLESCKW